MNAMDDFKPTFKQRVLHSAWGFFPWLLIAGMIILIVTMFNAIGTKKTALEQTKIAAMKKEAATGHVTTLTVRPGRLVDKIDLPAEVEPWENVWVKAEVSGQVINVVAQEGQRITEGQVIVQLDDRDYRSRMARIMSSANALGLIVAMMMTPVIIVSLMYRALPKTPFHVSWDGAALVLMYLGAMAALYILS